MIELLERRGFFEPQARFFGQRDDPLRDRIELALRRCASSRRFSIFFRAARAARTGRPSWPGSSGWTSSGSPSARSLRLPIGERRGVLFLRPASSRRSAAVISWAASRRWLSTGSIRSSSARCRSACCSRICDRAVRERQLAVELVLFCLGLVDLLRHEFRSGDGRRRTGRRPSLRRNT